MTQYFKRESDTDWGTGIGYFEFTDGWTTRHVIICDGIWELASAERNPLELGDQPLDLLDMEPEHASTKEEFETIWAEALKRCP